MKKALLLLFLLVLAPKVLPAQPKPGGSSLLYEREHNYGLLLHTKGWGGFVQFSRHRTGDNYRLLDFGVYSLKHPKEVKLPNPLLGDSRPYVFGKLNSPVILHTGYGARRILGDKILHQDVRMNLNYSFGPVAAIIKPVYYDVKIPKPENNKPAIVQRRFDEEDVAGMQEYTMGASSFLKGIDESGFIFGGNAKASLSFEWGPYEYKFYSLEVGTLIHAFPTDLPIFAYIDNDRLFVNLFLSLSYGARK